MNAIVARDLVKVYDGLRAVDGVSFEVNRGEIFALLGPNGAGKTTTVRMLTGLTGLDGGEAYVNGHSVVREKLKVKASIGVVPENSNLYDELTVEENLRFTARLYNAPLERVGELVEEFRLPADRKFGQLSAGLKRRAVIAAALVHDPPVLFLDEPTKALDVRSARAVREMIGVLNKRGKTIFLTTHTMSEAEKLPHRIAIMNRGKIVAVGKRNELKRLIGGKVKVRLTVDPISSRLLRELSAYDPSFDGEGLLLHVDDVSEFIEFICSLKERLGFRVNHISTELPSVEDVFIELTSGEEERPCACGGCPL